MWQNSHSCSESVVFTSVEPNILSSVVTLANWTQKCWWLKWSPSLPASVQGNMRSRSSQTLSWKVLLQIFSTQISSTFVRETGTGNGQFCQCQGVVLQNTNSKSEHGTIHNFFCFWTLAHIHGLSFRQHHVELSVCSGLVWFDLVLLFLAQHFAFPVAFQRWLKQQVYVKNMNKRDHSIQPWTKSGLQLIIPVQHALSGSPRTTLGEHCTRVTTTTLSEQWLIMTELRSSSCFFLPGRHVAAGNSQDALSFGHVSLVVGYFSDFFLFIAALWLQVLHGWAFLTLQWN